MHPLRAFHTVRHLRARQIAYQAIRRVQPVPSIDGSSSHLPSLLRRRPVPQAEPTAAVFDGRTFCFLNQRRPWDGPDRWHPRGADDLWIFNLHYFKWLERARPDHGQRLILDWIAENRDPRSPGWQPYAISLRVREWIEWLQTHRHVPPAVVDEVARSIASQVEWLGRRLEFNLMGNHLLENAIALCWAGASFHGPQSEGWLSQGERLFEREVRSQLGPDGSHEERSPMYQALLAEAMLRLAEVAECGGTPAAERVANTARSAGLSMLAALAPVVHPDGQYALMNDTAFGVAPTLVSLQTRFGVQGVTDDVRRVRRCGGFFAHRPSAGTYVVVDAGPIGPDHQPGHGHAGALSFELSARHRRVVTDTGVFTYASDQTRRYDRGTAAHNTVEIDGRDQSEVWGAFRCGRRSSILEAHAEDDREGSTVTAAYAGAIAGRSVAHRRRLFVSDRMLAFVDTVRAEGDHLATLRLHVAPGLHVRHGRGCSIIDERGHAIAVLASEGFRWTESSSPYHPEFGLEIARPCLSARIPFRNELTAKWWLILN
jgi:uncharacterized heparinase superfamily protein